jgi:hypothetical protein
MEATVFRWDRTLVDNVGNENRASEKTEGVKQLVHL